MTSQPQNECDPEVYKGGEAVFLICNLPSTAVEAIVVRVREETGLRVDWHFMAGRAIVRALGTPEEKQRVRDALTGMRPHWCVVIDGEPRAIE